MIKWLADLTTYQPEPLFTPMKSPTQVVEKLPSRGMIYKDAFEHYGPIVAGVWGREAEFMVLLGLKDLGLTWTNTATGKLCDHVYMNRDMSKSFLLALDNLHVRGFLSELKTFDGCFNIRDVRGIPGQPSCHSYGLAIDINAKENQLGQTPKFSPQFVQCFKDAGFDWGGDFQRKDGMHFSYGWEGKHEIIEMKLG